MSKQCQRCSRTASLLTSHDVACEPLRFELRERTSSSVKLLIFVGLTILFEFFYRTRTAFSFRAASEHHCHVGYVASLLSTKSLFDDGVIKSIPFGDSGASETTPFHEHYSR